MIDSYNILLIGSVFRTDCSRELMTAWEMVTISVVRMISLTSNQWKFWHNVSHVLDGFNHFVVILGKFIYMWLSLQIHTHSETISTRVQFCSLERNSRVISQMRKWGQECETNTRCYICENNMARHNMKQLHFLLLLLKIDFLTIFACEKSIKDKISKNKFAPKILQHPVTVIIRQHRHTLWILRWLFPA